MIGVNSAGLTGAQPGSPAGVADDRLLPLCHQMQDGNTADTPTVLEHLAGMKKQFRQLLGVEELLVAGTASYCRWR